MKTLLLLPALAAAAALAGCAAYGDPYGYNYPAATAVYQSGPGYGYYGTPVYQGGREVRRERDGDRERDRDGDGIPNRVDRDRDGDGIPNDVDRRPDNPRR
jgi:hypothetical protein